MTLSNSGRKRGGAGVCGSGRGARGRSSSSRSSLVAEARRPRAQALDGVTEPRQPRPRLDVHHRRRPERREVAQRRARRAACRRPSARRATSRSSAQRARPPWPQTPRGGTCTSAEQVADRLAQRLVGDPGPALAQGARRAAPRSAAARRAARGRPRRPRRRRSPASRLPHGLPGQHRAVEHRLERPAARPARRPTVDEVDGVAHQRDPHRRGGR